MCVFSGIGFPSQNHAVKHLRIKRVFRSSWIFMSVPMPPCKEELRRPLLSDCVPLPPSAGCRGCNSASHSRQLQRPRLQVIHNTTQHNTTCRFINFCLKNNRQDNILDSVTWPLKSRSFYCYLFVFDFSKGCFLKATFGFHSWTQRRRRKITQPVLLSLVSVCFQLDTYNEVSSVLFSLKWEYKLYLSRSLGWYLQGYAICIISMYIFPESSM